MTDPVLFDVLIVAARSQRGRSDRLAGLLTSQGLKASIWPPDVDEEEFGGESLEGVTKRAAFVVLLADSGFAEGRVGERVEVHEALAKVADRLAIVVVDRPGRSSLSLRAVDVFPTQGTLADLDESERTRVLEGMVIELVSELDRKIEPQRAKLIEEYRMLVESTDRLVQRRRETTQVFFGVNAALSAVIAFLVKDLALPGSRLSLVTIPLFVMGMVASQLWRRTIEQYATLIDWRYQQIRRMERRAFVGSYRLFNREWEAIYAPRPKGAFGFSGLESAVPVVFLALHALGVGFALAVWWRLLERIGF